MVGKGTGTAKQSDWKALGHDKTNNFWLKYLTGKCKKLAEKCNHRVKDGEWLIEEDITVISIIVFPTKTVNAYMTNDLFPDNLQAFSAIVSQKISQHLEGYTLFSEEQKGCCKVSILMNKAITDSSFRKKKEITYRFDRFFERVLLVFVT